MSSAASVSPLPNWTERNRQWLLDAIERLRARVEGTGTTDGTLLGPVSGGFAPALVQVIRLFGLSSFEGELLLLLAAINLDQRLAAALTARFPAGASYAAAFEMLAGPHWDALSPDAPLRFWRMATPAPGVSLHVAPLQFDERLLHFVAGVPACDAHLAALTTVVPGEPEAESELQPLATGIAAALGGPGERGPIAVLRGDGAQASIGREVALAAAGQIVRSVQWIDACDLPADPEAIAVLAIHLDREVALTGAVLVLAVADAHAGAALGLARRLAGRLIWLGEPATGIERGRSIRTFELPRPSADRTIAALRRRWQRLDTTNDALDAAFAKTGGQFHLNSTAIDEVLQSVGAASPAVRAEKVWPAARAAARGGLDSIARRIEPAARLDDLVVPAAQAAMLRDIVRQLHHGRRVYRDWGFGTGTARGEGLVALFAGESGTGKTLAAEAIAHDVGLDLYRIDLASLVSKYIGETEKNLKRLFDAAEASGAVLLFDEADALFGKRSEVKDSHDRYANIEVAYLLQRVEEYRGLAILTTNMKGAIDNAFLRRIRFVLTFPVPDATARERIWRRQLAVNAPLGDIDFAALARLTLTGGNIRSIAINAAFKAADADTAIDQPLLVAAAREELAKLERSASALGSST